MSISVYMTLNRNVLTKIATSEALVLHDRWIVLQRSKYYSNADWQGENSHLNEDEIQFLNKVILPIKDRMRPTDDKGKGVRTDLCLSSLAAGNRW